MSANLEQLKAQKAAQQTQRQATLDKVHQANQRPK